MLMVSTKHDFSDASIIIVSLEAEAATCILERECACERECESECEGEFGYEC